MVLTSGFSVEPPGIEPAPKMVVSCGNVEFDYAKVRETTCGYPEGVDGINTARPLSRTVTAQRYPAGAQAVQ